MRTLQEEIIRQKIGHTGHLRAVANKVAILKMINAQLNRLYARQNWPEITRVEKVKAKVIRSIPANAR